MGWDKADDTVITFECDSCGDDEEVNIDLARATSTRDSSATDFGVCWDYLRARGWVSFKRIGRPWSYHCQTCAASAELDHASHKRQEQERERVRARNAG